MASTEVIYTIKVDPESLEKAKNQIRELNKEGYMFIKLLKRSWLLRLIFGINLKKLEMEMTHDKA